MKLYSPFEIAPNLEPGLRIGDAWVTLSYSPRPHPERRQRYRWTWICGDKEVSDDDLCSGVGGGTLIKGFESMLSFLSAFAEARRPDSENHCLFPRSMREWAEECSDEIEMMELEISDALDAGDEPIDEQDKPDEDPKDKVLRLLIGMDDNGECEGGLRHIANLARRITDAS